MILSTTTFAQDPADMDIIKADKICSHVLTYDGVQFFSWGSTIVGKTIELRWNAMPSTQFDALNTLIASDTTMIFNPAITGSTQTYEVNLVGLDGAYFLDTESSANYWRINCKLRMLIMSEVT